VKHGLNNKSVIIRLRNFFKHSKKGYALLTTIIAVNVFTILIMKAQSSWETQLMRDMEEELLFRARQYVTAIEMYMKKNANVMPKSLDELYEKKFLRKRFKDPMTGEKEWNVVMRLGRGAGKQTMLLVSEENMAKYAGQAMLIGVASKSCEEGFKVYRKKKKYCEWAVYMGEQLDKDMPELKFADQPGAGDDKDGKGDKGTDDTGKDTGERGNDRGGGRDPGKLDDGRGRDDRGNGRR
jgi:hypothetical protein